MRVTPEMASQWLRYNNHNRAMRKSVWERYAEDMRAGRWLLTHQGVAFDEEGNLVDGQHRLRAVVESGVTVELSVTYGVPMDRQIVVDDHAVRSHVDALKLADHSELTQVHLSCARRMKD